MFSMLGIVLANNFVMMFIFWELVGLCSYLLIGHWFERDSAADAAKKAFITNRIGDFGFMLGILMIWAATGSVVFDDIIPQTSRVTSNPTFLTICVLLIFCGAVGKSAQFPLHVWLPDAMEGPTPISALIHAATMVAAGVYMLVRVGFLVQASPLALGVIAWIGTVTAVMAALIATQQDDIKRILAYSTLSQLGYMVMAVGLASGEAAMFHLFTHAFFKALLFLGAGSVLVALHHEQNIWKMGGQGRSLFLTFVTFGIGMLALIGCPPFAGFFSKDAILLAAHAHAPWMYWVGVITAGMTAFYVFRALFMTFFGTYRGHHHPHESPAVMTVPLMVLALLSLFGGFINIPHWLEPMFPVAEHEEFLLMAISVGAGLFGIGLAYFLYVMQPGAADSIASGLGGLYKLVYNKYFVDEVYDAAVVRPTVGASRVL